MSKPKITLLMLFVLAAGLAAGYGYGRWYGPKSSLSGEAAALHNGRKVLYWQSGMHPWIKRDEPGLCPICSMPLEPVYADDPKAPSAEEMAARGKVLYYADPSDPNYKADVPGLNPETGNDLVPVYETEPASMAPGTVQISPDKQQLIGVRFAKATYAESHESVRVAGNVVLDERRVSRVSPKVSGWIEKVYVDFTGDLVKQGQPLLTIYSPELLAGQREYLLAIQAAETLAASSVAGTAERQRSMLEAARRRLELLDLSPEAIATLERTREPQKHITVYAPATGYVMERNAFPSQRVSPETTLYNLADLGRVWVMAEIFEHQAQSIRPGQTVSLRFPYDESRAIAGRVAYIQPGLDPATRTLQARIEAPNPGMRLKPGMYLDVLFTEHHARMLTVPATAVLDTGRRQTVFVHRGNGYMEPREIRIGRRVEDRVEVLEGITSDDEIVVAGNFLIDSESQIQTGPRGLDGEAKPAASSAPSGTQDPGTPESGHSHH
ncbi:MAG: efflux RND transporter periplasmic adaptor subunit [Bryobacterales bacterium]|nr:efflux RND transporter periplasmic adaptor subunit [Bryobacterales bacterium]